MKTFTLITVLLATAITSNAQTSYPTGSTGCVGRWDFSSNGTFNTLNDVSGNGHNGTINSITASNGWRGTPNSSGLFNGTTSWSNIANTSLITVSQATIIALVKFNGFYSGQCQGSQIISKGYPGNIPGNYGLGESDNVYDGSCSIYSPNNMQLNPNFNTIAQNVSAGNYLQTGKWYFQAISYEGATLKYYQKEMDDSIYYSLLPPYHTQTGMSTPIGSNTQDLSIGRHLNPAYPYWLNGDLDEVILFNRILTDSEVQAVYSYLWTGVYINQPFTDTMQYPGAIMNVNYTVPGTSSFNTGNTFTVQLSDAAGSFATPVAIGTATSGTSGVIACTIPAAAPIGIGYRVRIVSSSPAYTSADDGKNIKVLPTGISGLATNNFKNFTLFPNPGKGIFTISGATNSSDPLNIDVTNAVGQVIYHDIVTPSGSQLQHIIALNCSNGIYAIHISNASYNQTILITVNK